MYSIFPAFQHPLVQSGLQASQNIEHLASLVRRQTICIGKLDVIQQRSGGLDEVRIDHSMG